MRRQGTAEEAVLMFPRVGIGKAVSQTLALWHPVRATELGGQWQVSMFITLYARASHMDSTYVMTVVRW